MLGVELRRLRVAAGLTMDEVAQALYISQAKVSRIENGRVRPSPRDVRDMLQLYGAAEERLTELLQAAKDARKVGWWHAYSDVVPSTSTYIGLEAAANQIRTYEALLVPGLLQTADYARAVICSLYPDLRPHELDRRIELRQARQALLRQDNPPAVVAILDEAVLRRMVGGREVMRQQLQRLIEDGKLETVTLQVLPFGTAERVPMYGSFTILGYQDPALPDVVYLEHSAGDLFLDNDKDLLRYTRSFEQLQESALDPDASAELLAELGKEL